MQKSMRKTLDRNVTIQKRAAVIYYASQGTESITNLSQKCNCSRNFVCCTIKGYTEKGINYIYECSRGIKQSALDNIEAELLEDLKL